MHAQSPRHVECCAELGRNSRLTGSLRFPRCLSLLNHAVGRNNATVVAAELGINLRTCRLVSLVSPIADNKRIGRHIRSTRPRSVRDRPCSQDAEIPRR